MLRLFFSSLPRNIIFSFRGWKFFFLLGAIACTFAIVQTGTDWNYLLWVRDPHLNKMFFPAVIVGAFVPVSLPLFLIACGYLFNAPKTAVIGWALGQAALIGSIVSSFLKALTGRLQPDLTNLIVDSSHGFQFGFMNHGIFWGWPSSHTTIAFAMGVTLCYLFPRHRHIMFYSIIYAFYVGVGVSLSIHWLSEFIAGALIGTAIGMTAGAFWYKQLKQKS